MQRHLPAFTLIELLLVMGVIGILSTGVILAINPTSQLMSAQNLRRTWHTRELTNALTQHLIDNGTYIEGVPLAEEEAVSACREGVTSDSCVNIDALTPDYIAALPVDVAETNPLLTGYEVYYQYGRYHVQAPHMGETPAEQIELPDEYSVYWKFDEGSSNSLADASGNGHTATLYGATWTAVAAPLSIENPYALDFDGNNDYIHLNGHADASAYGATGLTVMAWIRPGSAGEENEGHIIDKSNGQYITNGDGYVLSLDNGTGVGAALAANVGFDTTDAYAISANDLVTYDTWQHVAFVFDGSTVTLYRNGSALTPASSQSGEGNVSNDTSVNLHVGAYAYAGVNNFDGIIDDVRIYREALSAGQIAYIAAGN